MNFHSPIVTETAIPIGQLLPKAAAKSQTKAAKPAPEVFITGDPKGRTEAQWRRVKPTSSHAKKTARWRAELDAIAAKAAVQFPALGKLMLDYGAAAFRLDCALAVESELDEAVRDKKTRRLVSRDDANAISNPFDELEIKALLRLMRHRSKSLTEIQVLARFLAKLREHSDWDNVRDNEGNETITALLDGLSNIDTTQPHPDAGLLALKKTFDDLNAEADRLEKAHEAGEVDGGTRDAAYAKVSKVAKRIASVRANTLDGLLVKTAVWEWCRPDDPMAPRYDFSDLTDMSTTDMRIMAGLMKDLGRMASPPPSYSQDHPWMTVRRLSAELSAALTLADNGSMMAIIEPADARNPIAWAERSVFGDWASVPKVIQIETDKADALQAAIGNVRELVKTVTWDLANLDHGQADNRNKELDHAEALAGIVETMMDKLSTDIDELVNHLYGVNGANRTNAEDVAKALSYPSGKAADASEESTVGAR